jgi:dTDP-4-dehydrorhamnose reductase
MTNFDYSKVLTTGSSGMVGSYIDFGIKTNKDTLDILDRKAVLDFVVEHKPSAIIHLAGATDTALCETNHTYAFDLNGVGTLNVALAAQAVGALLVYVSTSRVFDGDKIGPYTESEKPNPKTVYGKSKYLGETIASLVVTEHLIVRGCWMFGGGPLHDNKFYGTIIKQLIHDEIVALGDVYGSPTYVKDFVGSIKKLIAEGKRGIVHVGNEGSATRAETVEHLIEITKSKAHLKAVTRDYFQSGHTLPTNESISSESVHLRPWQDALAEYVAVEWGEYLDALKN